VYITVRYHDVTLFKPHIFLSGPGVSCSFIGQSGFGVALTYIEEGNQTIVDACKGTQQDEIEKTAGSDVSLTNHQFTKVKPKTVRDMCFPDH
jgi:hypothetical protein